MSSYHNKTLQNQVNAQARSRADREPFRRAQIAGKLRPLNWGDPKLGIRRKDVDIFLAAAMAFDHVVVVRETNAASLPYIGLDEAVPKPIDCKPKTADLNAYIPSLNTRSHTEGLVVDPTLVGRSAFSGDKYEKAMKEWAHFLRNKTPDEVSRQVFRRRETKGYFAVDMDPSSFHYGCLMVSQQDLSTHSEFSVRTPKRRRELQYLHGDYDLYALSNLEQPNGRTVVDRLYGENNTYSPKNKRIVVDRLYGENNTYSPKFPEIKDFINDGIGTPMIQHGEQFLVRYIDDKIFAFYPDGTSYQVQASGASIKELFEVLFGENLAA